MNHIVVHNQISTLTKFLTGGRQTTRSTSLVGRDKPVAFDPKMFVLDRGHKTWSDRETLFTAQLMQGFMIIF